MAEHCNAECRFCCVSLMPSVTDKPFMLSVVMLNVIMLSIVMPNAVMLRVVMPNVVMLSVLAPKLGIVKI